MPTLIDGNKIAKKIKLKITKEIKKLKNKPKLAVILVGNDKASETYVSKKGKAAKQVGMDFELHRLKKSISTKKLVLELEKIQADKKLSGIIVQLPLPKQIDTNTVINAIKPELDVDCMTDVSLGRVMMNTHHLVPPTPGAVISILEDMKVKLAGKNITLIGTGQLVGRPLSAVLINTKASVTTVNETTPHIAQVCEQADILVSGVGKGNLVKSEWIKDNAILVDTGVSYVRGKITGDVDIKSIEKRNIYVTPTPGGVGPITVARLLLNTFLNAKHK